MVWGLGGETRPATHLCDNVLGIDGVLRGVERSAALHAVGHFGPNSADCIVALRADKFLEAKEQRNYKEGRPDDEGKEEVGRDDAVSSDR